MIGLPANTSKRMVTRDNHHKSRPHLSSKTANEMKNMRSNQVHRKRVHQVYRESRFSLSGLMMTHTATGRLVKVQRMVGPMLISPRPRPLCGDDTSSGLLHACVRLCKNGCRGTIIFLQRLPARLDYRRRRPCARRKKQRQQTRGHHLLPRNSGTVTCVIRCTCVIR